MYRTATGKDARKAPEPFTLRWGKNKSFAFSGVDDSALPEDEELRAYADYLYWLTLENKCFAERDQKTGAISKASYLDYLRGRKKMNRNTLFLLSMALRFDTGDMLEFAQATGENPVYNLRNAMECIFFYSHLLNTCTMAYVRSIQQEYIIRTGALRSSGGGGAGETRRIEDGVRAIAEGVYPSEDERRKAFLLYLVDNHEKFIGYSKSAREAVVQELNTVLPAGFNSWVIPDRVRGADCRLGDMIVRQIHLHSGAEEREYNISTANAQGD